MDKTLPPSSYADLRFLSLGFCGKVIAKPRSTILNHESVSLKSHGLMVMSGSYVWKQQKRLSSFKGQIGEVLARKFLENQGFKVVSYMFLVDYVIARPSYGPSSFACDFIGSMKEKFIKCNKTVSEIHSGSEHIRRHFDFVAKKEKNYYFVEVKTNKGQLSKWQKEGFQLSKRFGFIPMIVRTKVTLIADCKDVTVEVL